MDNTDLLLRLGVSLAIGLLTGIERGWSLRGNGSDPRVSGIRSYSLAGLAGGVAGILGQSLGVALTAAVFLGFAAVFAVFEWRESAASADLSVTSTLAGLLTFLLGTMAAVGDMQVAVAAAIVATALLALREALHAWVNGLTAVEIRDGLILLAMAFLLLPLLPSRPVDPWGLLNLRQIWILATMMAGVSFLGYAAVRGLGPRWGILITAAAGGLASSTATTLSLARMAHKDAPARWLTAGMLIASVVMLLRVIVIATVLQPALLPVLTPPLAAAALIYAGFALWFSRAHSQTTMPTLGIRSPLDLFGALRMALLIAVVLLVSGLVQRQFGSAGLYVVSAISGIADVDAITVSAAQATVTLQVSATAILIAVAVNSCSKAVLAIWVGRRDSGLRFLATTLAGIAVAAVVHAV
ncbi:MAG: MgtC/SapB family protein [bacterium]